MKAASSERIPSSNPLSNLGPQTAEKLVSHLTEVLLQLQRADGHWHFHLDDNATMNSEFIFFHRWLAIENEELVQKLANHLKNTQQPNGAWMNFFGDSGNLSTSLENYFALRMAGYSKTEPFMIKARDFILSKGGIPESRVFTKIWLALFNLYAWEGIPIIPPEIFLAPRGMPFHLLEFSYWSRMTIVPLTILFHLKKTRALDFNVDELYVKPEDKNDIAFKPAPPVDMSWIDDHNRSKLDWVNLEPIFFALNRAFLGYETKSPLKPMRERCVARAKRWLLAHQEDSGDWGGIQPPMINSIMALHSLGMSLESPALKKGLEGLHRFTRGLSEKIPVPVHAQKADAAVLQSCVSPIWDSALSALALAESGTSPDDPRLQKTREWLWAERITKPGPWKVKAKLRRAQSFAAWAFQYSNAHFPDVDDSAMVTLLLHKLGMTREQLQPAIAWLLAMQNTDGGWGTFDRDNNQVILNRIPFADLKSLIDPSNPDCTGHTLETLGELGLSDLPETKSAVRFLKRVQQKDGSWFGRWGVNAIYGTCAAVVGLIKVGESPLSTSIKKAEAFLLARQNPDGGFGEGCMSYAIGADHGRGASTPSQTAWALMTLHAIGYTREDEIVARATQFLDSRKQADGLLEEEFTGTGFPMHFYLRYDGYRNYFPLLALGRLARSST